MRASYGEPTSHWHGCIRLLYGHTTASKHYESAPLFRTRAAGKCKVHFLTNLSCASDVAHSSIGLREGMVASGTRRQTCSRAHQLQSIESVTRCVQWSTVTEEMEKAGITFKENFYSRCGVVALPHNTGGFSLGLVPNFVDPRGRGASDGGHCKCRCELHI